MNHRTIHATTAVVAMLLAGCGGGKTAPPPGDPAAPAAGTLTYVQQVAKVGERVAAVGNPIPKGAALTTDDNGTANFTLNASPVTCHVRERAALSIIPDDRILVRWEKGDGTTCRKGADGHPIKLGAGNTTIDVDEALLYLVVGQKDVVVQSYYGFVDLIAEPDNSHHLVGPSAQVIVPAGGRPDMPTVAELSVLPATHRQDVMELKAPIPPPDYRLAPAPGSPVVDRIRSQRVIRVATDARGGPAAREFVRSFLSFVAERWGVRLESTTSTPAAATQRLRSGALDLFVSPERLPALIAESFFDDDQRGTWSAYVAEGDEGLHRALTDTLHAALNAGDYGAQYRTAFGHPPTYEAVRGLVFPRSPSVPTPGPGPTSTSSSAPPRSSTTTPGGTTTSTATTTTTRPGSTATTTSTTVGPLVTANLVANPGAEGGPASPPYSRGSAPASWQRGALFAIAAAYGASMTGPSEFCITAGYPTAAQLGGNGKNLFSGGYDASGGCGLARGDTPTLSQVIPLAPFGARAVGAKWEASALLASYPASNDGAQLIVDVLDPTGKALASTATEVVTNPAGDFAYRARVLRGQIPSGATSVRLTLSFYVDIAFSGGFADDISFRFVG
jgi:hypothetical protein